MTTRDPNGDDTPPATLGGAVKLLGARTKAAESQLDRVEGMVLGISGDLARLEEKVEGLSKDVRHALRLASTPPPPPMPPMRTELPSHVDVRELARAIKNATLEGERRPDTTPDEQVDRVLERVVVRKAGRGLVRLVGLVVAAATSSVVTYLITHH